jgi:hypothetical protein
VKKKSGEAKAAEDRKAKAERMNAYEREGYCYICL